MPSAYVVVQQGFPSALKYALQKGYDEVFHTKKMQN